VRFYPNRRVREAQVVNDRVGDVPVVVAFDPTIGSAVAFVATVGEEVLRFGPGEPGRMIDEGSGSVFDLAGRALTGPRAGTRLAMAPGLSTRWYGFSQTYPGAPIWGAD